MEINDKDKLIAAFEHMVENVSESMHNAEEALAPTIDEMVHNAQHLARDIYALSQEEAESLGETLRRDMHKANRALNQQGKEMRDWLSFDLSLLEDRFVDMIADAADKTWLDFHAFERAHQHTDTALPGLRAQEIYPRHRLARPARGSTRLVPAYNG